MAAAGTLRYRPLAWDGFEHLDIIPGSTGLAVRSLAIGAHDGRQYALRYELKLDTDWATRSVTIERLDGRRILLGSDGKGSWSDGAARPLPALAGAIDVDISGTPLTNTLPIRRLKWNNLEPRDLTMVYIRLDTLEVTTMRQRYTRLGPDQFRYQNVDSSFEAILEVDAEGFVVRYPGLFDRVAD